MPSRLLRLIALLCLPGALAAQSKFEGVITARMSAGGRGSNASYSVKGDRLRMDMTGATGVSVTMLHDPAASLNVMLMHDRKMVMDLSAMQGRVNSAVQAKKPAVTMTGKKETVAGRECEHALITSDDGGKMDVCLARGMGSFVMGGSAGGSGANGAATPDVLSRLGADAFPLKAIDVKRGATVFEVTKIEKKSLSNDLFTIPAGYQKIDMGRMGRPML
jgi:hypothetical protein